jgi:hypothetical protein
MLKWAVTHVIGLHFKLTILGEYDVALTKNLGMLISKTDRLKKGHWLSWREQKSNWTDRIAANSHFA